jgi:hypothetical protein
MTIENLSQINYIKREIKNLQLELEELNVRNLYKSNIISDMPRSSEIKDANVEYLSRKIMVEDLLNYNLRKLQDERRKIEEFLNAIEDAETRLILRLRCINNMNWQEIGDELGMDRRTASRKFYKFFKDAHNAH